MAIAAKFEADFNQFVAEAEKANGSLGKIEGTSKSVAAAVDDLKSGAQSLAAAFGLAFSVGAAVSFVRNIIDSASALKDLGQQTHINVEELQLLAGGMSEFGVDADTLGKGLFKLSRGIAGGDESVATGLHLMGLSLKDVDGLQGKELFLKIEAGLATLQGGLRDTAAADLFNGKLGAAMAGASEGIKGALATWEELNHVASTESVDAMDAFGESIARAEKNLSSIAANMIGPVAQGFNVLNDAADRGAGKWAIFWAMTKDAALSSAGFGTVTTNLAKLLDDLNKKTEENAATSKKAAGAHDDVKAAVDTRTSAERFMAALEADAAVALDAGQIKNLEHLKEIGALNAKNAAGIGVNAVQFAKYTAELEKGAAFAKLWADAQEQINSAGTSFQTTVDGMDGSLIDYIRELTAAGVSMKAIQTEYGLTDTQGRALMAMFKDEDQTLKNHAANVAIVTALWADFNAEIVKLSGTEMDQAFANLNAGFEKAAAAEQKLIDEGKVSAEDQVAFWTAFAARWSAAINGLSVDTAALTKTASTETQYGLQQIADKAQATYQSALAHVGEWKDGTIQAYRDTADAAQRAADEFGTGFVTNANKALGAIQTVAAAQKAAAAASFALAGSAQPVGIHGKLTQQQLSDYGYIDNKGYITTSGALAGYGTSGGARASGGPVTAGASYLVGEQGPELYTPGASGFITPNSGGTVVNNYINVNGTAAEVAQKVAAEIMRTFSAGAKR